MLSKLFSTVLILLLFFGIVACGGYYRVKDLIGGNVYYTKDLDRENGTVMLKDANTGNTVTLQNSEVAEINKEEFKANIKEQ